MFNALFRNHSKPTRRSTVVNVAQPAAVRYFKRRALFAHTMHFAALTPVVPSAAEGEFHPPSIDEFFPPALWFEGTPFEINRIMLIRLVMAALVLLLFWLGTRKLRVVPGRRQSLVEMALDFVRVQIAENLLGKADGKRFLPILATIFFMVLAFNLSGIIPGMNLAGSALIGTPLVLAVVSYIAFIYAGVKKSPKNFIKNALFPAGVPWPFYFVVTPIELVSTFIIRPVTLTLRLLMNMMVGHLLLVLFFAATHFFLLYAGGFYPALGVFTFAFGFAFTLFEILVAVLQAYVFSLLTAVYIQLALAEEH